ncbi:FAD:protein FMN transferase [Shewanella donghaensis]|uniref:FAD:protein FMN transferase n=1 Tax=Shewanella donghaensis TaxID=238836 RepID=UPI00118422B1|nr:FAD:protein FMN transferase [Shewanella donghaensis]
MIKTSIKTLTVFFALFLLTACGTEDEIVSLSGNTMGTTYHIKVVRNERLPTTDLLQAEIDFALELVNDQMSTYRPKSELSQFNMLTVNQSLTVSADTITVFKEGLRLYDTTNGALDITLGPLINLWGFGPDKRPTEIPTPEQIARVKDKADINGFNIKGLKLTKTNPDIYVDLSSLAKGYGVDKIASLLNKYNVDGYLVEIGGEISVKGVKNDGSPWRIAVEKPSTEGAVIQQVVEPGNMALATSGDYRIYYEENGERFSHLIDPRTGYPIKHKLASVTVLHPSSMTADAYATAMMVLGTEESLALADREKLPVMLIEKDEDNYEVFYSEAFAPYIR